MECMKKLLDPITENDLGSNGDAWNVPDYSTQYNGWVVPYADDNKKQVETDLVNLLEGRVDRSTFDPSYLNMLENYYRFSATRYPSKAPFVAKRTRDTLELV